MHLLAGRYILVKQIGKGGFGAVEEYTDDITKENVAIKTIPGRYVNQESRRLVREIDIMCFLHEAHPHVIGYFNIFATKAVAFPNHNAKGYDDPLVSTALTEENTPAELNVLGPRYQGLSDEERLRVHHEELMQSVAKISKTDEFNVHIVMPLMRGDLFYFIRLLSSSSNMQRLGVTPQFLAQVAVVFAFQICFGLDYLHQCSIIHRDMKPDNVLVRLDVTNPYMSTALIADMGLARDAQHSDTIYICTRYYRPPEVITSVSGGSSRIDIWSLGCVLYEMCTGQTLFTMRTALNERGEWDGAKASLQLEVILNTIGTPSAEDIERYMPKGNAKLYLQRSTPRPSQLRQLIDRNWILYSSGDEKEKWIDLITRCVAFFPKQRPTAQQLCQHQLFKDYNVFYGTNVKQCAPAPYTSSFRSTPDTSRVENKQSILSLVTRALQETMPLDNEEDEEETDEEETTSSGSSNGGGDEEELAPHRRDGDNASVNTSQFATSYAAAQSAAAASGHSNGGPGGILTSADKDANEESTRPTATGSSAAQQSSMLPALQPAPMSAGFSSGFGVGSLVPGSSSTPSVSQPPPPPPTLHPSTLPSVKDSRGTHAYDVGAATSAATFLDDDVDDDDEDIDEDEDEEHENEEIHRHAPSVHNNASHPANLQQHAVPSPHGIQLPAPQPPTQLPRYNPGNIFRSSPAGIPQPLPVSNSDLSHKPFERSPDSSEGSGPVIDDTPPMVPALTFKDRVVQPSSPHQSRKQSVVSHNGGGGSALLNEDEEGEPQMGGAQPSMLNLDAMHQDGESKRRDIYGSEESVLARSAVPQVVPPLMTVATPSAVPNAAGAAQTFSTATVGRTGGDSPPMTLGKGSQYNYLSQYPLNDQQQHQHSGTGGESGVRQPQPLPVPPSVRAQSFYGGGTEGNTSKSRPAGVPGLGNQRRIADANVHIVPAGTGSGAPDNIRHNSLSRKGGEVQYDYFADEDYYMPPTSSSSNHGAPTFASGGGGFAKKRSSSPYMYQLTEHDSTNALQPPLKQQAKAPPPPPLPQPPMRRSTTPTVSPPSPAPFPLIKDAELRQRYIAYRHTPHSIQAATSAVLEELGNYTHDAERSSELRVLLNYFTSLKVPSSFAS